MISSVVEPSTGMNAWSFCVPSILLLFKNRLDNNLTLSSSSETNSKTSFLMFSFAQLKVVLVFEFVHHMDVGGLSLLQGA